MIQLDPRRTAVVAVDMHRGHLDPAVATLPLAPERCGPVIKRAAALFAALRERAVPVVHVVTETELADPAAFRPATTGTLTWRFRAENVRDFAWAASRRFVWDATSAGDVLIHALYRPEARAWQEAAATSRAASGPG